MMEVDNALCLNYEVGEPNYYRKVLIGVYWDDSETPNVIAAIGDFFCAGGSTAANFQCFYIDSELFPWPGSRLSRSWMAGRGPRSISVPNAWIRWFGGRMAREEGIHIAGPVEEEH